MMKRSEINLRIDEACELFGEHGFHLPPFARWSPRDWLQIGPEADEIRKTGLGWDVTDYAGGNFLELGLLLFTIRNGSGENGLYPKPYAEKIMVVREGQVTPYHFHFRKMEDIINRGGGNLVLQLYNSDADGKFTDSPCRVSVDGVIREIPAGKPLVLGPGESICIQPGLYHTFYGEKGSGTVMVGEVSAVNDDRSDNRFFEPVGRYPEIEEDEPPRYLLCHEYPDVRD